MKYFLSTDIADRFTEGSDFEPETITTLLDSCATFYTFDLFGKWSVAICFNVCFTTLLHTTMLGMSSWLVAYCHIE